MKGIHNYSDIGKLNRVLMHRIDHEVEGIVPDNLEWMLFDDIPYLTAAQKEYDRYIQILENNGVEVRFYVDEAAKAIEDPEIKKAFINDYLDTSGLRSAEIREILYDYLIGKPVKELVQTVITGVKKSEVPAASTVSLADYIFADNLYYMNPMPNLYFAKDPAGCIGEGVCE